MTSFEIDMKNSTEPLANGEVEDLLIRLMAIRTKIEAVKALYEEDEALVLSLQRAGFTEGYVDGQYLALVDNFANDNTVFRPAAVKRFDVKIISAEKHAEALAKAQKKAEKLAKAQKEGK